METENKKIDKLCDNRIKSKRQDEKNNTKHHIDTKSRQKFSKHSKFKKTGKVKKKNSKSLKNT